MSSSCLDIKTALTSGSPTSRNIELGIQKQGRNNDPRKKKSDGVFSCLLKKEASGAQLASRNHLWPTELFCSYRYAWTFPPLFYGGRELRQVDDLPFPAEVDVRAAS